MMILLFIYFLTLSQAEALEISDFIDRKINETSNVPKPLLRNKYLPKVLVLDAGHGGKDVGTIGKLLGSYEKNITMAYTRALANKLRNDYRVILTRNNDRYVSLLERHNIARNSHADLFLSLHADASSNRSVHGSSFYTISDQASKEYQTKLLKRKSKKGIIKSMNLDMHGLEVAGILVDLSSSETKNRSAKFAKKLERSFHGKIPTTKKARKEEGFWLLKGVDVPAVLIELGYLSNSNDEKLLNKKAHMDIMVDAIAEAIDDYFDDLG